MATKIVSFHPFFPVTFVAMNFFLKLLLFLSVPLTAQPVGRMPSPSQCSDLCNDDENCLCECFFQKAQFFRQEEVYDSAVVYYTAAGELCSKFNTQIFIDSIFDENRIWLYQNGLYAIATPLGDLITDYLYKDVLPFRKGLGIYSDAGGLYFINKNGEIITPNPGYDDIIYVENGLYYIKKNGKWWFVDKSGKDPVQCCTEGLKGNADTITMFLARTDGYESIHYNNVNGIAFVKKRDPHTSVEEWEIVDNTGKILTNRSYQSLLHPSQSKPIHLFSNINITCIRIVKNDQWGLLHPSGKEVLPPKYTIIEDFQNGVARLAEGGRKQKDKVLGGKWGLVNQNGEIIVNPRYDYIGAFDKEGFAVVGENGFDGIIDTHGRIIVAPMFGKIMRSSYGNNSQDILFSSDVVFFGKKGRLGVINKSGKMIFDTIFFTHYGFKGGIAWAITSPPDAQNGDISKDTLFIIDNMGHKVRIENMYDEKGDFIDGLAMVRKLDKVAKESRFANVGGWGFVDRNGVEVIKPQYYLFSSRNFIGGTILAQKDNKVQLIDTGGHVIFEKSRAYLGNYRWDEKEFPHDYLIHAFDSFHVSTIEKKSRFGLIDRMGNVLRYPFCDKLERVVIGNIVYWQYNIGGKHNQYNNFYGGYWGLLNESGQELIPAKFEKLIVINKKYIWAIPGEKKNIIIYNFNGELIRSTEFDGGSFGYDNELKTLIEVSKNGSCGIAKPNGYLIFPCKYERCNVKTDLGFDLYRNKYDVDRGKFSIDSNGSLVKSRIFSLGTEILHFSSTKNSTSRTISLHRKFSRINPFQGKLVWLQSKNENWELLHENGTLLLEQTAYLSGDTFINGLAKVEGSANDKYERGFGCVDTTGTEVIPTEYVYVGSCQDDFVVVKNKNNKWGWFDCKGTSVISASLTFNHIHDFSDGVTWAQNEKGWQLLDKTGVVTLAKGYTEVRDFQNGKAWVKSGNAPWRITDKSGTILFESSYTTLGLPRNALYKVGNAGKYGFIRHHGQEITPLQFDAAIDFFNGQALVKLGGSWRFIDTLGHTILALDLPYDSVGYFQEDRALVQRSGKYGFINRKGEEIVPLEYYKVGNYQDGVAPVIKDGFGYIDNDGREIVPCIMDIPQPNSYVPYRMSENRYVFFKNHNKGLLLADELTYIPPMYDEFAQVYESWIQVRKDKKWGYVDHVGDAKIPCRFDATTPFNDEGWATVTQNGLQFRINKKGEMLLPR